MTISKLFEGMTVGDRIKMYRIARRLTQKELADRCGFHHSEISRYEGGVTPRAERILIIAKALGYGVTSAHLLGDVSFLAELPMAEG